jgi:hypothetical protein
LVDRSVLVRTVESTDPRARGKRIGVKVLIFALLLVAMVFVANFVLVAIYGDESLYILLFALLSVLIMDGVTLLFISHHFHSYTEPIQIYSNGVDSFSSAVNKIRGVDGFLSRAEVVGIELKDASVGAQGERDYDRSITILLNNGKRRLLGVRSRETAMDVAKTMSIMWALPIEDFPTRQRRR